MVQRYLVGASFIGRDLGLMVATRFTDACTSFDIDPTETCLCFVQGRFRYENSGVSI